MPKDAHPTGKDAIAGSPRQVPLPANRTVGGLPETKNPVGGKNPRRKRRGG